MRTPQSQSPSDNDVVHETRKKLNCQSAACSKLRPMTTTLLEMQFGQASSIITVLVQDENEYWAEKKDSQAKWKHEPNERKRAQTNGRAIGMKNQQQQAKINALLTAF